MNSARKVKGSEIYDHGQEAAASGVLRGPWQMFDVRRRRLSAPKFGNKTLGNYTAQDFEARTNISSSARTDISRQRSILILASLI